MRNMSIEQLSKIEIPEKENLIDIANGLLAYKEIAAVLIVGSLVKGLYVSNVSGIDLIVLINDGGSEEEVIDILGDRRRFFYASDDIYVSRDSAVTLYIRNYNQYAEYLMSIVNSEAEAAILKDWAIGGVYKEVILDDISQAIIIFDDRGDILDLSNKLKCDYLLGDKFGNSLKRQLDNKMKITMDNANAGNNFMFAIGFWECVEIAERIFCHENRVYNKGVKHVMQQNDFLESVGLTDVKINTEEIEQMKKVLRGLAEKYEI